MPTERLMHRVGWAIHADRAGDVFEERGELQWAFLKTLLPAGFELDGRRVLDFGCGVGRILLPAVRADPGADHWGYDIHGPSVEWLAGEVGDRAHVARCGDLPPLPHPDGHFDLVYAFSVFTHLVESWSAWLAELHRLLADDGIAVITVAGPGLPEVHQAPLDPDRIGMNVICPWMPWDGGGPLVVHSEWWLRAHWGRAFEILDLRPGDPAGPPPLFGQGVVVLRRRPGAAVTPEELERPEAGEAREIAALRENVRSLSAELQRETVYRRSLSWRVTRPVRAAGRLARRVRS